MEKITKQIYSHSSKVNDLPSKEFIEKWFGIKKEIILGVSGGWSSEEVNEETIKKIQDILKGFPISWPEPEQLGRMKRLILPKLHLKRQSKQHSSIKTNKED